MESAKKQEGKMDMQAMIEVYKKLGAPGAVHKQLSGMVGSWTTKSAYWMEPGKPPEESTGTCEQKMFLGGRFLQQEYKSESMGETFAGINIIGYNNHTKKYQSVYMDSVMGTPMYYFEGMASADGKTITQESSFDDPIRGPVTRRSITRIVDENTLVYEMFNIPKGGKEVKVGEMTVSRKR
jgi:hypothetical protein